jgi:pimeloyl-ACP methyl ester carboxylesterase
MTSVRRKREGAPDIAGETGSTADIAVADGRETRPWRDSMLHTSHARIALRQTEGTELPILLLHAGGLGKEVFAAQFESVLGARHRMIAMDFPGHGASDEAFEPGRTYGVDGLADLALEALEAFDIDQAVIVGAGLGARVGLRLVETFPGLVGLVLTGTASEGARETRPVRAEGPLSGQAYRVSEEAAEFLAKVSGSTLRDYWPDEFETPVMIVDGAEGWAEETAGVGASERRGGLSPTVYLIPHAGDAPYLTVPTVFNHVLQQFMQRMDRRAKALRDFPPTWYGG